MNIGIIGAGTASAITILTFIKQATQHSKNIKITCIHNPSIATAQVGESTSALVYDTMREILNVDFLEDLDEYDGTLRYYTRFNWSNATGEDFSIFYHYPGIHLNSDKWGSYVFRKLKEKYSWFNEVHDSIVTVEQYNSQVTVIGNNSTYNFDFLVDCRGMPTIAELESDDYETDVFQSVNSVILFPDFKKYDECFTSSYVHSNGWMFGVPLQHRKAFGYLYNKTITSYEDAVVDFSAVKNIDASTLRNFSWQQYYKRNAIDGRILFMGNKLYFMEPQGAIPLHYYELLAEGVINGLLNNVDVEQLNHVVNKFNRDAMENIQNLIAFSYCGDTNIDSEFWNTIKERAREKLRNSENWQTWMKTVDDTSSILGYAPADSSMMRSYIKGFNINLETLRNNKLS